MKRTILVLAALITATPALARPISLYPRDLKACEASKTCALKVATCVSDYFKTSGGDPSKVDRTEIKTMCVGEAFDDFGYGDE